MDVQQLRARVAQLESAIDRTKVESAQATQQLEKEEDEGVVLSLWARITARKNAGKTLVEQLAAARAELTAAEEAAALVHYRQAQAAAAAAYGELKKSAAQTLAKAEAAAAAIDTMVAAQRGTGQKYTHVAGVAWRARLRRSCCACSWTTPCSSTTKRRVSSHRLAGVMAAKFCAAFSRQARFCILFSSFAIASRAAARCAKVSIVLSPVCEM